MKNLTAGKMRSLFLLGGAIAMMGTTMIVPQAAHADKAKNYKYGAAALGILGAVLAAKGNTVPGILAGAGAYYAYKKGADMQEQERNDWYSYDRGRDGYDYRYDHRNDNRYNDRYNDRSNDRYNDRYGDRYDYRNNNYGNYGNYSDNRYDNHDNRWNYNQHAGNRSYALR